ncbi:unnamed protein product [Cylicocyclus nassatus]|uniref:Aladin seven-bladed propeller domain-containing protein n=1 Tax=Cylicocyclus nassatus TaxID=53992 RepID=A0AA36M6C0_CYLNA|nr:unnamed protein product [Cylicocyclus nassatus]
MSLLEFPPLNSAGRPYAIQESNGRIITGNVDEFRAVSKCEAMADYPFVERAQLSSLQHSISKSDVADAFVFKEADRFKQAMDRWEKDGITGVIDHVAHITEDTRLWPLARLSRGVLRVRNGVANVAAKVLPSMGQDRIEELLQHYVTTLNWRNNWLRCVAVHDEGRRIAICQANNYIRIYKIGRSQKTPLTLKHPLQTNVASMAWEPFDQRVLAVAANNKILIWRLTMKAANIKPSVHCAQVIELPFEPISQLVWDRTTTNVLFAVSPNSNKIMIVDISTGDVDSFGAWTGGNVTQIVPNADGRRLAVLYTGNLIRVYDRSCWREERWGSLAGRAVSAVWSPAGDFLLFATEHSGQLYTLNFSAKKVINDDKIPETRWVGDSHAIPVFDLSPVEFDPSELEIQGAVEREIVTIGGKVQSLTLSPDGQRLSVNFAENTSVIAIFIVDWFPTVRLTPSGFVEAPLYGNASIITFLPKFDGGSLLTIVWSGGTIQYLPMLYGHNSSSHMNSRTILEEISGRTSAANRIMSDSLRSSELPSGVMDKTENDEIVLFTEKILAEKSAAEKPVEAN